MTMPTLSRGSGFLLLAVSSRNGLRDDAIALELRLDCIAAMPTVFREVFVERPLDQACYMWSDMLRDFRNESDSRIVFAMVEALQEVLAIPSRHCQVSALHGLGHLQHPSKVEYAQAAIAGKVL
jgi:hypothetical protein